jgi:hypothetical protein
MTNIAVCFCTAIYVVVERMYGNTRYVIVVDVVHTLVCFQQLQQLLHAP